MSLSTVISPRVSELRPRRLHATPAPAAPLDVVSPPAVPLVDGRFVRYANLDYAASAPAVRIAAEAVADLLPRYTAVHRGAGWLSTECTRAFEEARSRVAAFLGCRADDHVVFTRNTTESVNLLARALPAGTRTIVLESEHHATLLPWPDPIRLPAPASPGAAVASIASALSVLGTDAPVLVAVTGASNVTGELFPVADVVAVARRFGARVFLDAAQLAPHRPIDVTALDVDYVAFSGHKLYAPFGCGVLAGRDDWLDAAPPHLAGGGATAFVGDATCDVSWRSGPARHEGGSPNVIGAVALGAVCERLASADWQRIVAEEETLRRRLTDGLAAIDGVRQLHLFGADAPRVGTVTFTVDGYPAGLVAAVLSAEHGVGVRDGLFCAHPLTRRLVRAAGGDPDGQAVRASFGLGSTRRDIDRLVEGVTRLVTDGPAVPYAITDGRYQPVNDPRLELSDPI